MWFNGKFDSVTAVYQVGDMENSGSEMMNVESPSKLLLWEFRIRTFTDYQFISLSYLF
jgi:hypothetical protein